jgi:hypothetical protein
MNKKISLEITRCSNKNYPQPWPPIIFRQKILMFSSYSNSQDISRVGTNIINPANEVKYPIIFGLVREMRWVPLGDLTTR